MNLPCELVFDLLVISSLYYCGKSYRQLILQSWRKPPAMFSSSPSSVEWISLILEPFVTGYGTIQYLYWIFMDLHQPCPPAMLSNSNSEPPHKYLLHNPSGSLCSGQSHSPCSKAQVPWFYLNVSHCPLFSLLHFLDCYSPWRSLFNLLHTFHLANQWCC